MDWRFQASGLAAGAVLASIPSFFGPAPPSSLNPGASLSSFVSGWTNVASMMQYPLIAGLVLLVIGTVSKGSIIRVSAWIQVFSSFALGAWMLLSLVGVGWTTIDYPVGASATVSAQNLLAIGLLIPTISFASSLAWLFWDGRHNPKPGTVLQRWTIDEDANKDGTNVRPQSDLETLDTKVPRSHDTKDTSALSFIGVAGCILGMTMSIVALGMVGIHPIITGSNINVSEAYLFLVLFFCGLVVGIFGLGILIYMGVDRWQSARP
jgi:hypothetical protein